MTQSLEFNIILSNWIECNNYSITIGSEKRKQLAEYYSLSDDLNSRSIQNIFRGLTKCGLLVKCKKTDLICKDNKAYDVTYRVPFIMSQQKINNNFIKLNNEIIQLKSELRDRSLSYIKSEDHNIEPEVVYEGVNEV